MKYIFFLIIYITSCYSLSDNDIICGTGKKAVYTIQKLSRRRRHRVNKIKITCEICPSNTYQPYQNINVKDCIKCKGGRISNSGSDYCVGTLCQRGYFSVENNTPNCIKCPKGKYQNKKGEFKCKECLAGTWQPNMGSTKCLQEHNICKPGKFGLMGSDIKHECSECPKGKYTDTEGNNKCKSCINSYQPFIGKSECLKYPLCNMDEYRHEYSSISSGYCTSCLNISFKHKISFWVILGTIIFLLDYIFIMCYTSLHKKNLCNVIYSIIILIPLITFIITIGNCNNKKQSKNVVQSMMIITIVLVLPVIIKIGYILKSLYKR